MGWKYHVLKSANLVARIGFSFNKKLPAYYHGHWVWVDRACWSSLYMRYEPYMAEAIKCNLSRGGTFWDVGANVGLFSLFASKIVGTQGNVISFEPSPAVFSLLRSNTTGAAHIQIFPYGIGNADGSKSFAAQGTSSSASFIEQVTEGTRHRNPGQPIRKVAVTIRKIDSLTADLRPPTLVKIDVEGFEFEVLKGAEFLLSEIRPILAIEIHPAQLRLSGGTEEELFQLLQKHRYEWNVIDRNPNSLYSIVATPQRDQCPGRTTHPEIMEAVAAQ